MRLDAACDPIFARHETFHPRYGWVKKAVDAAALDENLFNAEDAVVRLGVGKNMVRSIRFWGHAYQVLVPKSITGSRLSRSVPSVIGTTMFEDDGWDPYCELPATGWLLHWWLMAPKSHAPVWWLAFNEFTGVEFNQEQLEQFVSDRVRDWNPHPTAIKKDVSCMLRMYAGGSFARSGFDDLIDCPSRELGLLSTTAQRGVYRFMIGAKPTLPPAIAAFACLDFIARTETNARTVTISRLANEPGGPGRAFKLTEDALVSMLENAAMESDEIEVSSAAGVPQLSFDNEVSIAGTEVLQDYYRGLRPESRWLGITRLCGPTQPAATGETLFNRPEEAVR